MEQPKYVAKKSLWGAVTVWRVLFFWLIIPLIVMIVKALQISKYTINFYDKYVIQSWGILSKHEKKTVFNKVLSVSVDQSIPARILGYGTLKVDAVGKWDVALDSIKKPFELKEFLEEKFADADTMPNTVID